MFDDKLSKDLLLSARANNNLAIIRILDDTTNIIIRIKLRKASMFYTGITVVNYKLKRS